MASRRVTLEQAEAKRLKAVEFLRRVGRDEDAEAFEAMKTAKKTDWRQCPPAAGQRRQQGAAGGGTILGRSRHALSAWTVEQMA